MLFFTVNLRNIGVLKIKKGGSRVGGKMNEAKEATQLGEMSGLGTVHPSTFR